MLVHASTVARASFIRLHCCTGLAREVFGVVRDMKDLKRPECTNVLQ